MTAKIALFTTALFAFAGMTACSVDAPTDEEFNYSFLDEMPGTPSKAFGFTANPVESHFQIRFADGNQGTDEVSEKISSVNVSIASVALGRSNGHGEVQWTNFELDRADIDLMEVADGEFELLASGPIEPGQFSAVAIELSEKWIVTSEGDPLPFGLPGPVLVIESPFSIDPFDTASIDISLGALRTIEWENQEWVSDPYPSVYVHELDE
jgi:hypothetical protein